MATYAQVEDLRDWFIDMLGEYSAKIDILNGDENQELRDEIQGHAEGMRTHGMRVIHDLCRMLVEKKREEYTP